MGEKAVVNRDLDVWGWYEGEIDTAAKGVRRGVGGRSRLEPNGGSER